MWLLYALDVAHEVDVLLYRMALNFAHCAAECATQPVAFVRRVDCGKCGTTSSFQLKRSAKCLGCLGWFVLSSAHCRFNGLGWGSMRCLSEASSPQHGCEVVKWHVMLWLTAGYLGFTQQPVFSRKVSNFCTCYYMFMLKVLLCWTASSTFHTSPQRVNRTTVGRILQAAPFHGHMRT